MADGTIVSNSTPSVEELQQQLAALQAENDQLKKNQREQNSYIGKLEAERQKPQAQSAPAQGGVSTDAVVRDYVRKKMRDDVMTEAMSTIGANFPKEVIELLQPELDQFLGKSMTAEKTTVPFVIDSFCLLFGRAQANPNHPIHKVLNAGKQGAPQGNQTPQQPLIQISPSAMAQQQMRQNTMSPADTNAAGMPATGQQAPIKDTKEALARFKSRFASQRNSNPFS